MVIAFQYMKVSRTYGNKGREECLLNAFILVIKQLKFYNLCAHMKHYFAHKLIIADVQKHLIKHSMN